MLEIKFIYIQPIILHNVEMENVVLKPFKCLVLHRICQILPPPFFWGKVLN